MQSRLLVFHCPICFGRRSRSNRRWWRWGNYSTLSRTTRNFTFFAVTPFHSPVLEPHFDLMKPLKLSRSSAKHYQPFRTKFLYGRCIHIAWYQWMISTWASVRPSVAANCRLSGFVMYFWSWKRFSNPFLWRLENTALDQERFRRPLPPPELHCWMVARVEKLVPPIPNDGWSGMCGLYAWNMKK